MPRWRRRLHKAALVLGAVAADGRSARDRLRGNLAFILRGQHHARNLALAGTRLDQAALARAVADADSAAAERLLDEFVLDNHTASGTSEQVMAALRAYSMVGPDEIVLAGVTTDEDLRVMSQWANVVP